MMHFPIPVSFALKGQTKNVSVHIGMQCQRITGCALGGCGVYLITNDLTNCNLDVLTKQMMTLVYLYISVYTFTTMLDEPIFFIY